MLSGSCGVLPEAVRRQVYVVRTSGARLLSLINDVLDVTALQHARLVLHPQRVLLRRLVDDVLDVARALVCLSSRAGENGWGRELKGLDFGFGRSLAPCCYWPTVQPSCPRAARGCCWPTESA